MYDTNAVNAVTRAMRSEVSDHVTASEKKSLREVRGEEHVRTLREGRRQFLWRKTIPLICLVSSKSRKSTFMNAYHLQILPQPHMLAQGFLKNPSMVFYELSLLSGEHAKTVKKNIYRHTHLTNAAQKMIASKL